MVRVIYRDGTSKEYTHLSEMRKKEQLKVSNEVLNRTIKDNYHNGKLTQILEDHQILQIIWRDRYDDIHTYDYRERYEKRYWDQIDFTK